MDNNGNAWIPRTVPLFVVSQLSEVVDWGLKMLGVPEWWKVTKAEGIKICVLDTGASVDHPDLRDNIKECYDFTGSPYGVRDIEGHSTHVCGIVAGRDNGTGITGIAPRASLFIAKVLSDNGCGDYNQIAAGIDWAASKDVDIISMSLGSLLDNKELHDAVKRAYDKGIIIVCAAGNDGDGSGKGNGKGTINYPAKYSSEVIAVGSINQNMQRSVFSSVGKELTIMAPGEKIYSCFPPDKFALLSGSSQATPFVSGVCALAMAKHRKNPNSLTPINNCEDMRQHLIKTAIKKDDMNKYGYGIVGVENLLKES